MLLKHIILYLITMLILFSCKTERVPSSLESPKDNKYDSEFPSRSVSKELSYISRTVKKLNILAFYATYYFPPESKLSKSDINDSILKVFSNNMSIIDESVFGTVSVVYNNNNLIGLLTCAHIVDFKDTIYSYYDNENSQIQTLSLKIKQQNHVSGLPSGDAIKIVALNREKDIALLMKKTIPHDQKIHVLNYPLGTIKDLQWGSVVYIMGYPLSTMMVTRAIVSLNDKLKVGMFVTDALFNPGISGSPVFAIRDGVPNFDLVGIASSSASLVPNFLVPVQNHSTEYKLKTPYKGNIFVDNNKLISYGVTYSVSIDEITTFISTNEEGLIFNGFDMNYFFK